MKMSLVTSRMLKLLVKNYIIFEIINMICIFVIINQFTGLIK